MAVSQVICDSDKVTIIEVINDYDHILKNLLLINNNIMELLVYEFPQTHVTITKSDIQIEFETSPVPKLMKYGFNNMIDYPELNNITNDDHYRAGLNFDFERKDPESINSKGSSISGTKSFNQTFCEFWEIMILFELFNYKSIQTSHPEDMTNVISAYNSIIDSAKKITVKPYNKSPADLFFHKFSDVDIDENIFTNMLMEDLDKLCQNQTTGSNCVVQLFGCQSQVTVELIYYMISNYEEAYIYKPLIVSDLFDCKYLVMLNLKKKFEKINTKKNNDHYFSKLFNDTIKIPTEMSNVIQCMNSQFLPKKFVSYGIIKKYLDTKVFEGATYHELIEKQNNNSKKWIDMFFTNVSKALDSLKKSMEITEKSCNFSKQIDDFFA